MLRNGENFIALYEATEIFLDVDCNSTAIIIHVKLRYGDINMNTVALCNVFSIPAETYPSIFITTDRFSIHQRGDTARLTVRLAIAFRDPFTLHHILFLSTLAIPAHSIRPGEPLAMKAVPSTSPAHVSASTRICGDTLAFDVLCT